MPLDDLYQQDTNRALDALSLRPAEPAQNPRSAWSAPFRAIKAAVNEVAGTGADLLKAYGAAAATTLDADPIARAAVGDQRVREGATEGRRQIDTGEAMSSSFGDTARAYAREQRPDPVTAGTAEKVVFEGVRVMSKLVAGGLAAGPFGIAAAAGEEGITASDDLRQQGVDFTTRASVGVLTAGVTGAGAFLPLAGSSLKATAGLYLAGGPGAFVAQQAATRAILEQANYGELAKLYDPLDPVGLAVSSLIPLPFAAHGAMRNAGRAGAAKQIGADMAAGRAPDGSLLPREGVTPDAVDATLVHNLTLQADQQQAINAAEAGRQMAEEMAAARAARPEPVEPIQSAQPQDAPAKAETTPGEGQPPGIDQNRLTDTETPPAAPSADPVQQRVAQRVQALEQQAGDMAVKVGDDGRASTVRDEIARIRREVAEGTDDELGALDADLLRVAAECALTTS